MEGGGFYFNHCNNIQMSTKTEFQKFIYRVSIFIVNDPAFKKYWKSPPYIKFLSENLRRYSEYTEDNKCIINRLDLMLSLIHI